MNRIVQSGLGVIRSSGLRGGGTGVARLHRRRRWWAGLPGRHATCSHPLPPSPAAPQAEAKAHPALYVPRALRLLLAAFIIYAVWWRRTGLLDGVELVAIDWPWMSRLLSQPGAWEQGGRCSWGRRAGRVGRSGWCGAPGMPAASGRVRSVPCRIARVRDAPPSQ